MYKLLCQMNRNLVIIETGHSSLACKEWIDLDMRNIFLILDHLGIYAKPGFDMMALAYSDGIKEV